MEERWKTKDWKLKAELNWVIAKIFSNIKFLIIRAITPQWIFHQRESCCRCIYIFNSAVAAFIPAFVFGVGIISIILYLIFR
jgi:hypothetical protein